MLGGSTGNFIELLTSLWGGPLAMLLFGEHLVQTAGTFCSFGKMMKRDEMATRVQWRAV